MLYLSLFCLNLLYKSLDVYNSGGGVVPNSDVYKYSDPKHYLGQGLGLILGQENCTPGSQNANAVWHTNLIVVYFPHAPSEKQHEAIAGFSRVVSLRSEELYLQPKPFSGNDGQNNQGQDFHYVARYSYQSEIAFDVVGTEGKRGNGYARD